VLQEINDPCYRPRIVRYAAVPRPTQNNRLFRVLKVGADGLCNRRFPGSFYRDRGGLVLLKTSVRCGTRDRNELLLGLYDQKGHLQYVSSVARIKRLKETVLAISPDYSIARPPTF
jgi:hypothetical protein